MQLCGGATSERLETAAARYRDESGLRPETTHTEAGPRTEPSSVRNWDSASRMSAAIVGRISDPVAPLTKDLRRWAERHVELDRLVEIAADLVQDVAARQANVLEAAVLELLGDDICVAIANGPGPQVGTSDSSGWSRYLWTASSDVCSHSLSIFRRQTIRLTIEPGARWRQTLRKAGTGWAKNITPQRPKA